MMIIKKDDQMFARLMMMMMTIMMMKFCMNDDDDDDCNDDDDDDDDGDDVDNEMFVCGIKLDLSDGAIADFSWNHRGKQNNKTCGSTHPPNNKYSYGVA